MLFVRDRRRAMVDSGCSSNSSTVSTGRASSVGLEAVFLRLAGARGFFARAAFVVLLGAARFRLPVTLGDGGGTDSFRFEFDVVIAAAAAALPT